MNVIGRHRRFFLVLVILVAVVAAVDVFYLAFGHQLIARARARRDLATLSYIIPSAALESPDTYFTAANWLMVWYNLIALALLALLVPGESCSRQVGRLYEAVIRACDRALRRPRLLMAVGGLATLALLAWIALVVLQAFPNSGDEYCYLYQAMTWRAGRLSNPAHPLQTFFQFSHIRDLDGRVFSVFPPGWPLVLLLALYARLPLWLVNPLLGSLTLLAFFRIASRWFGERVALLAVATTLVSSFYLFNSASFYAHTFCLLLTLMFANSALQGMEERSFLHATLAGVFFGAAFATRFFTVLMCGAPLCLFYLLRHRRQVRFAVGFLVGAAPVLLAFLWYNHALMGQWFVLPMNGFENYDQRWFAPNLLGRGTEIMLENMWEFLLWVPAVVLPAYFITLKVRPGSPRNAALGYAFLVLVVGYYFYVDSGGNRYGPRYYFEALPFVVMPAIWLIFREPTWETKSPLGQWLFYLYLVSMVLAVPLLGYHAAVTRQVIWERTDLYRTLAEANLSRAVVFVSTPVGTRWKMEPYDLTRNGIDDSGSVLYVHDRANANRALMEYYPDRTFFRYTYDIRARRGKLEPVEQ